MLDSNNPSLGVNGLSEYGESFLDFLEKFYVQKNIGTIRDKGRIIKACERMEKVHAGQKRKSGVPYHMHPYQVAKIYCLAHKGKFSETGLVGAILHDNIENAMKSGEVEDFESVENLFGTEDAIICEVLSKNPNLLSYSKNTEYFSRFHSLQDLRYFIEILTKEKGFIIAQVGESTNYKNKIISRESIGNIAFKVAVIKISDRIHNLGTMNDFSEDKIQDKITETEDFLLDIAKELGKNHSRVIEMLKGALFRAKQQLIRSKAKALI